MSVGSVHVRVFVLMEFKSNNLLAMEERLYVCGGPIEWCI